MQSRMPGRVARISVVVSLLAGGALPAQSQTTYVEQVMTRLAAADEAMTGLGYTRDGEATGWMLAGASSAMLWTLDAGDWAAVAVCDEDCTDIDMEVATTEMEVLAEDVEMDANPLVRFSLSEQTTVGFTVEMLDCQAAECFVGLRWYRHAGEEETEAGADPDDTPAWVASIAVQLEEGERAASDMGLTRTDQHVGLLAPSESDRLDVRLEPGRYFGFAVCDNDCSDIDLAVLTATGVRLDADALEDAKPVVEFQVDSAQELEVQLDMVSCSAATCGYGFRLYRRN